MILPLIVPAVVLGLLGASSIRAQIGMRRDLPRRSRASGPSVFFVVPAIDLVLKVDLREIPLEASARGTVAAQEIMVAFADRYPDLRRPGEAVPAADHPVLSPSEEESP